MLDVLHVVTVVSNPLRWESRYALAKEAIGRWLSEPNVHVTLVEVPANTDRFTAAGSTSNQDQ